jgi:hypothetical protein
MLRRVAGRHHHWELSGIRVSTVDRFDVRVSFQRIRITVFSKRFVVFVRWRRTKNDIKNIRWRLIFSYLITFYKLRKNNIHTIGTRRL